MEFIWKIENFSYTKDNVLQSPSFCAYSQVWEVVIYPKGASGKNNYFSVELLPLKNEHIHIPIISFAFLDSEGSPQIWRERKIDYDSKRGVLPKHFYCTFDRFIKCSEIFGYKKNNFLPNDVLTVQCCLWDRSEKLIKPTKCFARTRIEPCKWLLSKEFSWDVTLTNFQTETLERIEIIKSDFETLKINLECNKEVKITITPPLKRININCKMWLLDTTGKMIEVVNDGCSFDRKCREWHIITHINKHFLEFYKDQFLLNDNLSLKFLCTLSSNVTFNRMVKENEVFADNFILIDEIPDITKSTTCADVPDISKPTTCADVPDIAKPSAPTDDKVNVQSHGLDLSSTVSQALWNMYEEGFLSDFNLRVGDKIFPIHKALLGIRSPVFRTMFTVDLSEVEIANGCFDILDMDADTLQKILQFIYTDKVDSDMPWETATKLFAAAANYGLECLKQSCSTWFKSKFCVTSVLDVLLLATIHHDQNLKSAALDFISLKDMEIIGTDCWEKFEEKNTQLALETCRDLYLKKIKLGFT